MADGLDDFLHELRGQIERCAEAAARETSSAPRRTVRRVGPWGVRPALAWAVFAAAVVGLATGGIVASRSTDRPVAAGTGSLPLPGQTSPYAVVRPPAPIATGTATSGTQIQAPRRYLLNALAGSSPVDLWAVGSSGLIDESSHRTTTADSLILRWDGRVWNETPHPDIGPLNAVAVAPGGEAWAAGGDASAVLHWNGGSWSASATGLPWGATLAGLAAPAPNDVWAVGSLAGRPLVVHWDGSAWSPPAELPDGPAGGGILNAVSASSGVDVWAVGSQADGLRAMTYHWDGSSWSYVSGADLGEGGLQAVAALAPADVWAAGGSVVHSLDGLQWNKASAPLGATATALSAQSSSDVWVSAGTAGVAHWDGSVWRQYGMAGLLPSAAGAVDVRAVTSIGSGDVWAVGSAAGSNDGTLPPLIFHWDGATWRLVVDSVKTP